ncbi:MAG: Virus attachment protein p12 family protein [Firmicutes bacterium ADurb.Bin193]|nr:MAG: Virus attachment protein p12 family protein [Firmicutes bacterium ADurb.Bin193]
MINWIIGIILFAAFLFAGYRTFKNSKNGGCKSCCGCPEKEICHK